MHAPLGNFQPLLNREKWRTRCSFWQKPPLCPHKFVLKKIKKKRRHRKLWTRPWLRERVVLLFEWSTETSTISASSPRLLLPVWCREWTYCLSVRWHHVSDEIISKLINIVITQRCEKDQFKLGCSRKNRLKANLMKFWGGQEKLIVTKEDAHRRCYDWCCHRLPSKSLNSNPVS